MFKVVGTMVFDKFKSWRKEKIEGIICPACQHKNLKETNVCTRCYYQLDRPSFEQDSTVDNTQSSDLLDELMKDVEEQQEEIIAASFSFDDVSVDIAQYSDDDQVDILGNPQMSDLLEQTDKIDIDENYELKPEDTPQYVKKFEIPETQDKHEIKDLEPTKIDLVQPTSETPNTVEIQSPSEILNVSDTWNKNNELSSIDPLDFDGDGKVDDYEKAFADEDLQSNVDFNSQNSESNQSKENKIPRIKATPILNPDFSEDNELSHIKATSNPQPPESELEINNNFWPWEQQEEWSIDEVKRQLLTALRAAANHNIAEATVLIDEVGPHLGPRHSLVYAVGKLLRIIGRSEDTERMISLATKNFPDDKEIILASNKLVS
tara:strand:- start:94 stop:1224 length:1131 start_codon:yes stop_codon:yes gene_type:complete